MCHNDFVKGRIISLFEEGKTQELISKKFDISQSTVSRTIAKYKKTENVNNLANMGRPRIFNTYDRSVVKSNNKKNPEFSFRKISKEYRNSIGKDISYVNVKNILNKANIFSFPPIKKPFFLKKNILNRVIKERKFLAPSNNEIKTIIFSDESKFELCNSNKRDSVWRAPATAFK